MTNSYFFQGLRELLDISVKFGSQSTAGEGNEEKMKEEPKIKEEPPEELDETWSEHVHKETKVSGNCGDWGKS